MVSDQRNITAGHKVITFLRLSHKSCLENKSKNPSYLHDPPSPLIFLDVSIFGYKTSVYFLRLLLVLIKGTPPHIPTRDHQHPQILQQETGQRITVRKTLLAYSLPNPDEDTNRNQPPPAGRGLGKGQESRCTQHASGYLKGP